MNKFYIPTHLLPKLTDDILKDICHYSIGSSKFQIVEEKRGHNTGQYIKLKNKEVIKYICLSGECSNASRNSFILQNFPTAYQHYLEEKSSNKEFEYYIRDVSVAHPPYTVFAYKVLLTAGIKILNIDKVIPSNKTDYDFRTPFLDFKQMRRFRLNLQQKNSGNSSTLFEETEDEISVYGKSYGANGRETTAICLALKKLVDLPIKIYNVNETDPNHLANVDPANKYILESIGVIIDDGRMDFEKNHEGIAKRDSKKYHYNLLQKFKEKKCYLCGCDIEKLIIGSHIHRVTDIIHSNLSEEEKQKQIVDENNGFWLCANHDKLFEYGLIYFNNKDLIISHKLNEQQTEYVKYLTFGIDTDIKKYQADSNDGFSVAEDIIQYGTKKFSIDEKHYNEKMHQYLEMHKNRVTK